MITDQYAQAFRAWINAADPGYAPTALYGRTGAQAVTSSAWRGASRRLVGGYFDAGLAPAAPGLPVRETSPKARRTHAASAVQPGWD